MASGLRQSTQYQYHPGDLLDAQGSPQCSRGVVLGGSWSSPGTLLNAPGFLWGTIWGAWEEHLELFGMVFVSQSSVRHENSEKLESDDHLDEKAMFLRPQGFQNKTKIVPELAKRRKKSREEAKREQRVSWEPSRPAWGRFPSISSWSGGRGGG